MQVLLSGAEQGEVGSAGILAVLEIYDLEARETVYRLDYRPPQELQSSGQKVQFTGFCFSDDALYVCTHNEIVVYRDWPPTEPAEKISLPGFNDLHHCFPWDGALAVANTGLETVDLLDYQGRIQNRWDLLDEVSDSRDIDPDRDYRLVSDTKPHVRHVNHLFELDDELWATQLATSDAICLTSPGRRISMEVGMPHDGVAFGDEIVFTTTNGHLVFARECEDAPRPVVDLNAIEDRYNQLGWCRGVWKCSEHEFLVGFSTVRRSKWRHFGYFLKHGHDFPPSRITLFDLKRQKATDEWLIGKEFGFQLFQFETLPNHRRV